MSSGSTIPKIATAEECQDKCANQTDCVIWEWVDIHSHFNSKNRYKKGDCYLKDSVPNRAKWGTTGLMKVIQEQRERVRLSLHKTYFIIQKFAFIDLWNKILL